MASQQTGMLKLLPLGQQQEYNELQLRLALYKKRSKKGLQMGPKAKAKGMRVHVEFLCTVLQIIIVCCVHVCVYVVCKPVCDVCCVMCVV